MSADMRAALRSLMGAYVSLLETGRDRIVQHGGDCDSVEVMEAADPALRAARAALASQPEPPAECEMLRTWLEPLGALACAAKDRDASKFDQESAIDIAHGNLFQVLRDSSHNAPWLTAAHALCTDAGIPQGHIGERIEALRLKIGQSAKGQSVPSEWRKRFGENPLRSIRKSECDPYTWSLLVLAQDMMTALDCAAPSAPAVPNGWPAKLEALRAAGWAVAVHNDYRLSGERHTFWLFTRDGRAIKGEGKTDDEALTAAMLAASPEPPK